MEVGDAAQWAVVVFIVVGLAATWWRNNKSSEKQQGSLETEVKNVKNLLEDKDSGLAALKHDIYEMKETCASVRSNFGARISHLEKK